MHLCIYNYLRMMKPNDFRFILSSLILFNSHSLIRQVIGVLCWATIYLLILSIIPYQVNIYRDVHSSRDLCNSINSTKERIPIPSCPSSTFLWFPLLYFINTNYCILRLIYLLFNGHRRLIGVSSSGKNGQLVIANRSCIGSEESNKQSVVCNI